MNMNRLSRNDFAALRRSEEGDEEKLYERQALIYDNDDFCDGQDDDDDDEIETSHFDSRQVVIRNRQQQQLLDNSTTNGYELKGIKAYRDINSEPNIEFTYYDIQPNDSLQSICLRYACQISQVKRLNGLMTDQDFYGLRRLKLPLGKLGLLEDVLKQQQQNGSRDLLSLKDNSVTNQTRPKIVNSPGSALSITIHNNNNNKHNQPRFKPLLSPGYSSDRINELTRSSRANDNLNLPGVSIAGQTASLSHNSHSFSSLREFTNGDTNINIINNNNIQHDTIKTPIPLQNFIKSEIVPDPSQITIDNMLTDDDPIAQNVFEDLDYHVERAKAAAEGYEKRAADIVNGIDMTTSVGPNGYTTTTTARTTRASKIPELFFSGENFGLNLKKLIMLIFFVCLVIPLVYMTDVIK